MRRLEWAKDARADLDRIVSYFSDKDVHTASLLLERIELAAQGLARADTGRPGRMPNLREKSVPQTKYIIAYRTLARRIVVLRIIHASQNWTAKSWPKG